MKNHIFFILKCTHSLVLMMFLISVPCFAGNVSADRGNTIVIANGEWLPFLSEKLKNYGVFAHIITESFASEGITVVYKWRPWKRAYKSTLKGKFHATATWVPTPERKKAFYYSDTILVNSKVFFYIKTHPFDWDTVNDLKNLRIGGVLGYTYGDLFDKAEEDGKISVERVPTEMQNFKKLLAGRIQIYPQELEIGYGYICEFPPDQACLFTHHPMPIMETTHHLIFSKNVQANRRFVDLFNKGLLKLKESGKYDAYLAASRLGKYKK